jgi:rRNA small subunit pseudouridine methyltransferase Nep1
MPLRRRHSVAQDDRPTKAIRRTTSAEDFRRQPLFTHNNKSRDGQEDDTDNDADAKTQVNQENPPETIPPEDRITRPLPSRAMSVANRAAAGPTMVPVQPTVPKTPTAKANSRRLIVVLEQACLEAYKVSGGPTNNPGTQMDAVQQKRSSTPSSTVMITRESLQKLAETSQTPDQT